MKAKKSLLIFVSIVVCLIIFLLIESNEQRQNFRKANQAGLVIIGKLDSFQMKTGQKPDIEKMTKILKDDTLFQKMCITDNNIKLNIGQYTVICSDSLEIFILDGYKNRIKIKKLEKECDQILK